MILPIYTYGQSVLKKETQEIDQSYPGLTELIQNMWDTLEHSGGVGLAAPQVGVSIRMAIIDLDVISEDEPQYKGFRRTYINPYIEEFSDETETIEEGCLSLPGKAAQVTRPNHVIVKAYDEEMKEYTVEAEGLLARAFCHEIDHLDGHMYTEIAEGPIHDVEYESEETEKEEEAG